MLYASTLSRRDALRAGMLGSGLITSPPPSVKPITSTVFDVTAYGALGDGKTDDTAAIQNALHAAGAVPGGAGSLRGESELYSANGPAVVSLTGSVLAPIGTSTSSLLTIGVSGNGTVVNTNPHGLTIEGLGFLGTAPGGLAVSVLWAATVLDTSDVTFIHCRDLYCGSRGTGSGGFVQFLSSGTGNAFSVNGRALFCNSFGAGVFLLADGLATAHPGGGSTDGQVVGCQVNRHNQGVVLGPVIAGAGGWSVAQSHFSSEIADSHVDYGRAGNPWTLRLEGCYFDVCGGPHVISYGRGLQAVGNYFRALSPATTSVEFGAPLSVARRDPAGVLTGNVLDLNGATTVRSFARFDGFTAAGFGAHGGGEYRGNLVHDHGSPMPKSWVGQFLGSDGAAVANTGSAWLDLMAGPVLGG